VADDTVDHERVSLGELLGSFAAGAQLSGLHGPVLLPLSGLMSPYTSEVAANE
jgi:hypothetical protein